jgi:predicted transposase YbfD/YdcC/urease gamma subunit
MDQPQYSNVMAALQDVPDPRKARGKQLEWSFVLGVIAAALLSQQRSGAAIAQWAREHTRVLVASFHPVRRRVPSESTLRRALHRVDVASLEQRLARLPAAPSAPAPDDDGMAGYAVDGKYVRGAGRHGQPTLLVSVVAHTSTAVAAQTAVAANQHESTAVLPLLAGRDLHGMVITMDAGLTQAHLARQILAQGGHYLMVVKRNQRQLYDELTWFFDAPPLPCDRPWRTTTTVSKGHGRLETRRVTCTDDLDDFLPWPGVQQVLKRDCERIILKTGTVTRAVTYGLTSLTAADASAAEVAALWRGHWTIENRRHYVRDVTLGEDAHQMHVGQAPQALAAVRNGLISVLRAAGWRNIAAGLRHYNSSPRAALQFIGVPCPGL